MASAPEKEDAVDSKEAKSKEMQIMEPHALIPITMRAHRGRRLPKEARQTYIPENALHYYLESKLLPL